MIFSENPLRGSYTILPEPLFDERGFFSRYFCENEFAAQGLNTRWMQINNSMSLEKGTLRGLHFQNPPHAEVKMVRCIRGAVWDVIVDLRKGSQTFGKWFGVELTAENRNMMYVPKGFAHGFISLTSNSELIYMVSNLYASEAEQTLLWSDEEIDITWPLRPLKISEKDSNGNRFSVLKPFTI
jgi:dTDP-4-dehydrorhamnose 3,5-epimerase